MTQNAAATQLCVQRTKLGVGLANNSINTVPFRSFGCHAGLEWSFFAAFVSRLSLRVFKLCLKSRKLEYFDLAGEYPVHDAHNCASIGIDAHGFLHLAYSDHGGALHYRRSLHPFDVAGWSAEAAMTGSQEDRVTYPYFLNGARGNSDLKFIYRFGNWKKARVGIKILGGQDHVWRDQHLCLLAGDLDSPWYSCPYLNTPSEGPDGVIHLAYTWRVFNSIDPNSVMNLDLCHIKSKDGGQNWFSANGFQLPIPVTRTISETVVPAGRGRDLMNQCGSCVAVDGSFHIAYLMKDRNGNHQYWYACYQDDHWQYRVITKNDLNFSLFGKGTLRLPLSRPEIAVFPTGEVFLFYCADATDRKLVEHLVAKDFGRFCADQVFTIGIESLGSAEVCVDRSTVAADGVLRVFEQSNGCTIDGAVEEDEFSEMHVVEISVGG